MDHDGTFRHGSAIFPGAATHAGARRSSYNGIVAPPLPDATGFVASQRSIAVQHPSIQRYNPQNAAIVASINGATNNFGDIDAEHTPNQAGRVIPRCDGGLEPIAFGAHPNIDGAKTAADGAAGTPPRVDQPRDTLTPGQRPPPLSDAALVCDCCLGSGRHAHLPSRPCSACHGTGRQEAETP